MRLLLMADFKTKPDYVHCDLARLKNIDYVPNIAHTNLALKCTPLSSHSNHVYIIDYKTEDLMLEEGQT